MPGCQSAFEPGPVLGSGIGGHSVMSTPLQGQGPMLPMQGDDMTTQMLPTQPSHSIGNLWQKYKDICIIAIIVYVLLRYAVPQGKKYLPGVLSNVETSMPATALLAVCAGGVYHCSNKVISTQRVSH